MNDASPVAANADHDFSFESCAVFATSQRWVGIGSRCDTCRYPSAINYLDGGVVFNVTFDSVSSPTYDFRHGWIQSCQCSQFPIREPVSWCARVESRLG
jgi:hypothetical protein